MYRFQKFARKHKAVITTAAAIAVCLLLGTTVSAWQAVRATTAEADAVANAQQANTQRDEAQRQRDEIKTLYEKLADKDRQLQQTLYSAHINLAQRAWDVGNIHRVNELLEQHQPKPGETDLRGFEWHYLHKLCHPESRLFHADGLAFSPDGRRLALATKDSVKIIDTQTYRELLSLKGSVWFATFNPDGKRLATAVRDEEDQVKEWDAETGRELHVFKGHNKGVWEVAYSPDGKRLASVGYGKTVIVRDIDSGREMFSLTQYTEHVAFSPDGNRLATCNGPLRVWDAYTGKQLLEVATEPGSGFGVAFSPDGKRLAGCGRQGQMKVWDAHSGVELLAWKGHAQFVHSISYSPDGKRLGSASHDKLVKVWNAETGDELFCFKGHSQSVQGITFHPSGARLASMSKDGTVRLWDTTDTQQTIASSATGLSVRTARFGPMGQRLVGHSYDSNSQEASVRVWDVSSGRETLTISAPGGRWSRRVAKFSPDGKRIAAPVRTGDNTSTKSDVKVWDAETGQELSTLTGHTLPVVDLAFSPDGRRLVSCGGQPSGFGNDQGKPCEVKIWDVVTGEELLAITGHKSLVNCVAYSPEGKRIATLSRDDTLKVWDAQTGQELLSMLAKVTNGGSLAFSPDGKRIASADNPRFSSFSQAGEVKIWDAENGKEILTLQGHTAYITGIAFSPDGHRLASSAGEVPGSGLQGREVKLWDAQSGEELLTMEGVGDGGVDFSPDGHRLVTAGREGLRIYDATPLAEKP